MALVYFLTSTRTNLSGVQKQFGADAASIPPNDGRTRMITLIEIPPQVCSLKFLTCEQRSV